MLVRLAAVTTMIALFGLSFSVLADNTRQRSFATPVLDQGGQDCLTAGLLCAPRGDAPR